MKTTIEVPDALAREAKSLAAEQGVTLRELVVSGLRAEIARRTSTVEHRDFVLHTVGGRGLRPDVDPRGLTDLAYDQ